MTDDVLTPTDVAEFAKDDEVTFDTAWAALKMGLTSPTLPVGDIAQDAHIEADTPSDARDRAETLTLAWMDDHLEGFEDDLEGELRQQAVNAAVLETQERIIDYREGRIRRDREPARGAELPSLT